MTQKSIVYLVDDEAACLKPVRTMITRLGYDCRAFSEIDEFLTAVLDDENAIVLADYSMPRMNGVELFQRLRDEGIRHPFLLLSGSVDHGTIEAALRSGVLGFMQKPFSVAELQRNIQTAFAVGASSPY